MVQSRGFIDGAQHRRMWAAWSICDGDFPVLSAGPTPHIPLDQWSLRSMRVRMSCGDGLAGTSRAAARAHQRRYPLCDQVVEAQHEVGRRVARYTLERDRRRCVIALVRSFGGYTTNLPLEDLLTGRRGSRSTDGEDLAEHGGPARLIVPHLYFWKSAKGCAASRCWIATNLDSGRAMVTTSTEIHGRNSVLGRLSWKVCTVVGLRDGTATARTIAAGAGVAGPRRGPACRPAPDCG